MYTRLVDLIFLNSLQMEVLRLCYIYSTAKQIPKMSSNFDCGFEKKFGPYYGINATLKKILFAALKISIGIKYNCT